MTWTRPPGKVFGRRLYDARPRLYATSGYDTRHEVSVGPTGATGSSGGAAVAAMGRDGRREGGVDMPQLPDGAAADT
ncbi:MAG: hypothetical protein NUW12_08730 [Firmicutes bacterium]|nr:hypothetical protein [Bacillota bacterium]MDH7496070.1 hypothetical protein [Bacillota bacterium]